jgi:hypothetical protein
MGDPSSPSCAAAQSSIERRSTRSRRNFSEKPSTAALETSE